MTEDLQEEDHRHRHRRQLLQSLNPIVSNQPQSEQDPPPCRLAVDFPLRRRLVQNSCRARSSQKMSSQLCLLLILTPSGG